PEIDWIECPQVALNLQLKRLEASGHVRKRQETSGHVRPRQATSSEPVIWSMNAKVRVCLTERGRAIREKAREIPVASPKPLTWRWTNSCGCKTTLPLNNRPPPGSHFAHPKGR